MKGAIVTGLGKNIKKCREKAGLTQEKLAEMVGISPNYLSALEREAKVPAVDTFVRILNVIGLPLDEMLEGILQTETKTHCSRLEKRIGNLPLHKQRKVYRIIDEILDELENWEEDH
ncbi:MAG: helix-turn-helix transcriptional regulator [Hespellia sp.]|nr:helix-turn-helix transcriptional regulator [Hespellia sp.]